MMKGLWFRENRIWRRFNVICWGGVKIGKRTGKPKIKGRKGVSGNERKVATQMNKGVFAKDHKRTCQWRCAMPSGRKVISTKVLTWHWEETTSNAISRRKFGDGGVKVR